MNILFIYNTAQRLGGAMTLAARITNWMVENGHEVDILVLEPEKKSSVTVTEIFSRKARFHYLDTRYRYLPWYPLNFKDWVKNKFSYIDVIIPLKKESLYFAGALYSSFQKKPIIVPYVIDNIAYTTYFKTYNANIIRKYFCDQIPDQFKMFMSNRVREMHETSLLTTFRNSKILLLPIKLSKHKRKYTHSNIKKIISIGRLDHIQKKYIFHLPMIVKKLRYQGYDVICDIYGHGDDTRVKELRSQIEQNQMEEWVTYHGEIEYSKFHEVLNDCYLFVGMGTSAIEASMFGVPSVVATAFCEEPISYGLMHELPLGVVGEDLENGNYRQIQEIIEEMCSISANEYDEVCNRHREYVKSYDLEVICPEFIKYLIDCIKSENRSFCITLKKIIFVNFYNVYIIINSFLWKRLAK